MFDWKILLIILAIAIVIFGTKRLRSIGSDLGEGVKAFKDAVAPAEDNASPQKAIGEREAVDVHVESSPSGKHSAN
jgi:sec-independent protein translocase protein TatA